MQSSIFNLRVPIPAHDEVFLMNTLTEAELLVSTDVAALLDRVVTSGTEIPLDDLAAEEREALELLRDNGFLVADRQADRRELERRFTTTKNSTAELHITLLT